MNPKNVAARFAAFVCYLNRSSDPATPQEAGDLARENWQDFLPYVDENLGKWLESRDNGQRIGTKPKRRKQLAVALA